MPSLSRDYADIAEKSQLSVIGTYAESVPRNRRPKQGENRTRCLEQGKSRQKDQDPELDQRSENRIRNQVSQAEKHRLEEVRIGRRVEAPFVT